MASWRQSWTHSCGIVENICFAFSFAIVPYLLCVALMLHKHVFVSLDLCFMVFCTCLVAASTSLYYISPSLGRSTKKTKYICLSWQKGNWTDIFMIAILNIQRGSLPSHCCWSFANIVIAYLLQQCKAKAAEKRDVKSVDFCKTKKTFFSGTKEDHSRTPKTCSTLGPIPQCHRKSFKCSVMYWSLCKYL